MEQRVAETTGRLSVSYGDVGLIPVDGTSVPIEELRAKIPTLAYPHLDYLIQDVAFFWWPGTTMISCSIRSPNGSLWVGESIPAKTTKFEECAGIEYAYKNTVTELLPIHAYMERSKV